MTTHELSALAERYALGESTIEDDVDMIRVLRAMAKLEGMPGGKWDISAGLTYTIIEKFNGEFETALEAIESYKEVRLV